MKNSDKLSLFRRGSSCQGLSDRTARNQLIVSNLGSLRIPEVLKHELISRGGSGASAEQIRADLCHNSCPCPCTCTQSNPSAAARLALRSDAVNEVNSALWDIVIATFAAVLLSALAPPP